MTSIQIQKIYLFRRTLAIIFLIISTIIAILSITNIINFEFIGLSLVMSIEIVLVWISGDLG